MNNWLPRGADVRWKAVYDLKGSADDKTLMYQNAKVKEVGRPTPRNARRVGFYSRRAGGGARRGVTERLDRGAGAQAGLEL
jgi:hypothetical protein